MPIGGTIRQGRIWTNSHDYTGGDMQPIPLPTGGIMYTKFNYGPDGNLIGQLWLTTRATPYGNEGRPLTSPSEDCMEPSLSPDGRQVTFICTYERQIARLEVASWNGSRNSGKPISIFPSLFRSTHPASVSWRPACPVTPLNLTAGRLDREQSKARVPFSALQNRLDLCHSELAGAIRRGVDKSEGAILIAVLTDATSRFEEAMIAIAEANLS